MGYYGGDGARKVASVEAVAPLPQTQPACVTESTTGLVDCGNWAESASWAVPAAAVSGLYFAHLVREDQTSEGSHIYFVVRDDGSHSDLLFQTSDTTWQAYNRYDDGSISGGRASSRWARSEPGQGLQGQLQPPDSTRAARRRKTALFNAEYPMIRWLEPNGYDVSYSTGVDTDAAAAVELPQATRSFSRLDTTSTGRASSAPTSKRRATPA